MAHTYTRLLYHVVFSTKDRRPLLDADLRPRLFAYFGGVVGELRGQPILINGVADHVHGLVWIPPTVSVTELMRVVKTNTSRWVHETWPERAGFAWQTGYGAFTVSQSQVEVVRQYIAGQEDHHRTMTFQEEYLALLTRHGIEFDERYVWE